MPTCAFTMTGKPPRQVAEEVDEANIYVWDGNYYALGSPSRLRLEDFGGMVRAGPVHYNTVEEIQRFGEVLQDLPMRLESKAQRGGRKNKSCVKIDSVFVLVVINVIMGRG